MIQRGSAPAAHAVPRWWEYERAWRLLGAVLIGFGLVWAVIELSEAALGLEPRAFDRQLLLALRTAGNAEDPLGPAWFEQAMRDLTSLGSLAVIGLMSAAAAGFLVLRGRWAEAALGCVVVATGEALSAVLKLGFDRPRPELVPHEVAATTASFPSGHATLTAAAYLTWALILTERTGGGARLLALTLALAATLFVGVSRVYLGVHWPTDVLAGWVVGGTWAAVGYALLRRLQPRP